LIADEEQKIEV